MVVSGMEKISQDGEVENLSEECAVFTQELQEGKGQ